MKKTNAFNSSFLLVVRAYIEHVQSLPLRLELGCRQRRSTRKPMKRQMYDAIADAQAEIAKATLKLDKAQGYETD